MVEMTVTQEIDAKTLAGRIQFALEQLNGIILGKADVTRNAMVALLANGHLLIEDVPGVGKTTLARSLAHILDCQFQRISFTSDMMPSDILGVSIFNRNDNTFNFHEGPVFTNILLADELNRTTPKTQSAFLEAMESHQVTVEKKTYPLPEPFLVMATQNPLEFSGTFPLPVSQLDRFLLRISIGYPDPQYEERILVKYRDKRTSLGEVTKISVEEVLGWQHSVPQVRIDPSLVSYIIQLAQKTRDRRDIQLGVSPRATLALQRAAQANALIDGRDFVTPDDIQKMVISTWAHRIILTTQPGVGTHAFEQASEVIELLLSETAVPV
jgi:MoxR-like ATPase